MSSEGYKVRCVEDGRKLQVTRLEHMKDRHQGKHTPSETVAAPSYIAVQQDCCDVG